MKTTFTLSQGTYVHTISVNVNANADHSVGQLVGMLAHRFYTAIGTMRMMGNGSGINLRNPFDIAIESEGITLLNTLTLDESIKARITCGLTARGQKRFAKLLALSLWANGTENGEGYAEITDSVVHDLLDEQNCVELEHIAMQVRALLDMPYTDVVECSILRD
ncbi:MAG: hypothetical protein EBR58_14085 [Betaproteobacteria bacterium]|nr:hypothetical protein [Betaproteobacteria bacterium]